LSGINFEYPALVLDFERHHLSMVVAFRADSSESRPSQRPSLRRVTSMNDALKNETDAHRD